MRELRQADYNSDELAWEVIEEIVSQIKANWSLDPEQEREYQEDRKHFDQIASGDGSNAVRDQWMGAEDYWRAIGENRGIEVYDDGEAGYTYIGPSGEISDRFYGIDESHN